MPKKKNKRTSTTRSSSENVRPRRCAYCGRPTTCPAKQRYVESDPHVARWPHAPRSVPVVPLCELARRTWSANR